MYAHPLNKVVFESDDFRFEIPICMINRVEVVEGKEFDAMRAFLLGIIAAAVWQKKNKIFSIEFVDENKD